ncbi:MAG: M48 family metalloprotease [Rhodovibrionaceae bacterium]
MKLRPLSLCKGFLALALAALLAGCAGANYRLPALSDSEIAAASQDIQGSDDFQQIERSAESARALVHRAERRIEANAGPVCKDAGVKTCNFNVVYDHSSEVPNAWAEDPYKITLTRGLLQFMQNEDEVAAIVGHEMGHHIVGHLDKKRDNYVIGSVLGAILGAAAGAAAGDGSTAVMGGALGSQAGGMAGIISYSKEHEREADYISVYLLARAGYDLDKASQVWARLAKMGGRMETGLLDTHPASPDRLAAWRKAVDEVEGNPSLIPVASVN